MIFYASLTNSLLGLYYPVEAETENEARAKIASSDLARLWCSVYSEETAKLHIQEYGGWLLPHKYAQKLDYDTFMAERLLE